ncbi:FAD/NAD(P)-binding domain-containing protein [Acaromyces ingoldii]|uniref:FAD/NAD(P)-binding domain-containing protein n=1 Tax=Acaromyces ingoldii TaxID=215250 RepID=A0A316YKN2_9BASI|nr:FAD/NAD(P)-binding domain-containing protein [Acaromyces ingoldii]PWN89752.1 FAD/NAD(P)-binding domain-containing protein [Acaromyces ingoldii]
MTNKPSSLRIIICGAGIAGLAAAAALATHHQVIVLERKEELTEVSYAINLKPNAAHAAYGVVGLDPSKVRGLPCREIIERDAANGDIKMHKPVDAPADFGGPWYFCQRTELHAELLATAKARGAKVILGTEIEDVNATHGVVLIKGGDAMVADMVLIADGISSRLRKRVLQQETDYRWDSDQVAFRAFVPAERFRDQPELKWLAEQKSGGLYVWAAQKQRVVVYPCPDYVNLVAIVDKAHLQRQSGGSDLGRESNTETADAMRSQFADFDSTVKKLLDKVPHASLWPLFDVSCLPYYERERALLIGDAAHATLPHQGQGASLAFEDAEGLAYLFCNGSVTPHDVSRVLKKFTELRRARVHMIQHFSRVMAKPASYEKGEKLDALRFAAQTLTFKSIAELETSTAPHD